MNACSIAETHSSQNDAARVLIADDQVPVLDALQLLLKSHGFCTEAVSEPSQVLPALQSDPFDVVLMDMNYERDTTAGDEGLELVSQIRSRDQNMPVLVMTAWGSVELAVEAMRRGASDFVQKPWQNQQLLQKLRTQIERGQRQRRAQRSSEGELREAQEIQSKLLPRNLPAISDYEIAAITQPIRFVGGDYYNVVRVSENETALCIADVAGKGMAAALLMSSLQAALRPLIWQKLPPRELCRRLNRMLCEITPVSKFISFFYGVLNNEEHRLTYCNAGHNPPIVLRDGTGIELNAAGAVLGQFPDWAYEQSELPLRHGDSLLMFTDGLVEAPNSEGEPFGEWGLMETVKQNPLCDAAELLNQLMHKASEHCDGTFQDDATLLVLRAI